MSEPKETQLPQLNDEQLQSLFAWVDEFKLTRPKRNFTRDFSDGVLAAQILKNYFPKHVEIHNYQNANSVNQKMANWDTLNRKVMAKMNYQIPRDLCQRISKNEVGVVEVFLFDLKNKLAIHVEKKNAAAQRSQNGPNGSPANAADFKGGPGVSDSNLLSLDVHNPMPLSQLDLRNVDIDTKLILQEKEQALLASQETVAILNTKVRRLEHLLKLKDQRIEEQRKSINDLQLRLQGRG